MSKHQIITNVSFCPKGALVYPRNLEDKMKQCRDFFKLSNEKKVSLFIGGSLFDRDMFSQNLKAFLKEFKKFARRKKYRVLVSTSRRTLVRDEETIESQMRDFELCEAAVYANKANYDFV